MREQQEHAFKAFTEVLYRLIRGFTEVLCNIWNIYQYAKSLIISL